MWPNVLARGLQRHRALCSPIWYGKLRGTQWGKRKGTRERGNLFWAFSGLLGGSRELMGAFNANVPERCGQRLGKLSDYVFPELVWKASGEHVEEK